MEPGLPPTELRPLLNELLEHTASMVDKQALRVCCVDASLMVQSQQ